MPKRTKPLNPKELTRKKEKRKLSLLIRKNSKCYVMQQMSTTAQSIQKSIIHFIKQTASPAYRKLSRYRILQIINPTQPQPITWQHKYSQYLLYYYYRTQESCEVGRPSLDFRTSVSCMHVTLHLTLPSSKLKYNNQQAEIIENTTNSPTDVD